jgi:hypothetical protein
MENGEDPGHEDGRVDNLGCEGGYGERAGLICLFFNFIC